MKKIVSLLALGALTFSACQKNYLSDPEDTDTTPNPQRGTFECLINGNKFVGEIQQSFRNTEDGMNTLTISAIDYYDTRRAEDYQSVTMTIGFYDGPKEYQFHSEVSGAYSHAFTDEVTAVYGLPVYDENTKLILTAYDDKAAGEFSFKVVNMSNVFDTLHVTEGKFDFPVD